MRENTSECDDVVPEVELFLYIKKENALWYINFLVILRLHEYILHCWLSLTFHTIVWIHIGISENLYGHYLPIMVLIFINKFKF